eukprot:CAMPEP_0172540946 /NCGR_PEP_ID=MMETSP1067-20121228/11845_1 /TAXON_ID=265564 ORGANISM="Thalassiosira punctigera, Strain Tpunct2005C2" /NCGR_SAMPLE_ID=MMETSP1067 /ASSEMBLY_ACC=CAM_ASM_000444 /LENGTH=496 /DNA_ID=CAMNT_0013326883 /DNA_START=97 /DNA_END=1587 /DNA_ORIENTATION=-
MLENVLQETSPMATEASSAHDDPGILDIETMETMPSILDKMETNSTLSTVQDEQEEEQRQLVSEDSMSVETYVETEIRDGAPADNEKMRVADDVDKQENTHEQMPSTSAAEISYEMDLNYLKQRLSKEEAKLLLTLASTMPCTGGGQNNRNISEKMVGTTIGEHTFSRQDVERILTLASVMASTSTAASANKEAGDNGDVASSPANADNEKEGIEVSDCSGVPIILTDDEWRLVRNALIGVTSGEGKESVVEANNVDSAKANCTMANCMSTSFSALAFSLLMFAKGLTCAGKGVMKTAQCACPPMYAGLCHLTTLATHSSCGTSLEKADTAPLIFERIDAHGRSHSVAVFLGRGNRLTPNSSLRDAMIEAKALNGAVFRSKTKALVMEIEYYGGGGVRAHHDGMCNDNVGDIGTSSNGGSSHAKNKTRTTVPITIEAAKFYKLSYLINENVEESSSSSSNGNNCVNQVVRILVKDAPEVDEDEYDVDVDLRHGLCF